MTAFEKLVDKLGLTAQNAVVVHNPSNMFYLTQGYTGEGCVLISGTRRVIITDFRYTEAAEAEARAREEARRAAAAAEAKEAVDKMLAPDYTYVSKTVRLLFRHQIDPNITKRIHEIILSTIKYFHKENVYIKIRATVPDSTTVNLFFEKIPEEENELLIDIIKILGKSELGITKVYLE